MTAARAVTALRMVAKACLAVRYDHYPSCCVEASSAGAEALRRFGVKAETAAVIGVVFGPESIKEKACWLGATAKESYELMLHFLAGKEGTPSFKEFELNFQGFIQTAQARGIKIANAEEMIHMVVLVESSCLLDLTFAQAGAASGIVVPDTVMLALPDKLNRPRALPHPLTAATDSFEVCYFPRARPVAPEALAYKNEGLTQDLQEMMMLALECDLDEKRFWRDVRIQVLR